jgi:carbon monoxide dehydrogenase subunit G
MASMPCTTVGAWFSIDDQSGLFKRGEPMASIYKEIMIEAEASHVWDAVSDVAHQRLVPGVLVDTRMEGDARVVTFANGAVARELIVTIDHASRRFVYASTGGLAAHHNASFQVFSDGEHRTRLVWITDVLPDELEGVIRERVELGAAVMEKVLRQAEISA